jgi:hypothetical protein
MKEIVYKKCTNLNVVSLALTLPCQGSPLLLGCSRVIVLPVSLLS